MNQQGTSTPTGVTAADPAGGTTPVGVDRTNDPKAQPPDNAPAPDEPKPSMSPEARNQRANGQKSRAESGTP